MQDIEFDVVKCVTSGDGFIEGKIYAVVGVNNGIHVLRESEYGDCYEFIACSGGIGMGDLNNFDDSGKPSFDYMRIRNCLTIIDE